LDFGIFFHFFVESLLPKDMHAISIKFFALLSQFGRFFASTFIFTNRALEESKRGLEFARKRLEQAKVCSVYMYVGM